MIAKELRTERRILHSFFMIPPQIPMEEMTADGDDLIS
jgi:hypothetical protein